MCKLFSRRNTIAKGFLTLYIFIFSGIFSSVLSQTDETSRYVLWYRHPAAVWTEALPVGNGSLGAMIFGGVDKEHLQMNEETVWTHGDNYTVNPSGYAALKTVRELLFNGQYSAAEALAEKDMLSPRMPDGTNTYQTLGDLTIAFAHDQEIKDYCRSLNLQTGMAKVEYNHQGIHFSRYLFSSYPDQVMVFNVEASQPGQISAAIQLSRPGNRAVINTADHTITMQEHVGDSGGVNIYTVIKVVSANGVAEPLKNGYSITKADGVMLLITAATDYRGDNPEIVCQHRLNRIRGLSFEQLRSRHLGDYSRLFSGVDLTLGHTSKDTLPTDARLSEWQEHPEEDLALLPLYFQYGRYLLISSSRPGTLPANLQGIWCNGLRPPWNADYHININLQMNYWPAEVTRLSECLYPLFDFTDQLVTHGKETAQALYHAHGSVAHHTTDVWYPTTCTGRAVWGLWPLGMAWLSRHYWDHYLFSGDPDFLSSRAYPVLKETSAFFMDYLVQDPVSGKYVSGPSTSPENRFITPDGDTASISMGNAMDQEMITELFTHTIEAARILQKDKKWIEKLQQIKNELAPVKISPDGRIMEWSKPFAEAEPGHRHMSHLYGLYPGTLFTWSGTPELMQAAEKTLSYRLQHGGGHTGWSRAWIINFYARLGDGEKAWNHVIQLINHSTLPNLFDTHPPFQIDGNFGGTAGIAEMLLQSQGDTIRVLPSVPGIWDYGSFSGLVARNGFILDVSWDKNGIQSIQVHSDQGKHCNLSYHTYHISFPTVAGHTYFLTGTLEPSDRIPYEDSTPPGH